MLYIQIYILKILDSPKIYFLMFDFQIYFTQNHGHFMQLSLKYIY